MKKLFLLTILWALLPVVAVQAQDIQTLGKDVASIKSATGELEHEFDLLEKKIDDLLWYEKVGDVANIDKVFIYGPPKGKISNPTAVGAKNPLKFWAYVFVPKNIDLSKKYPLMVFAHSGVHADFSTYYAHIVRELLAQGYVIVAADYRGSTGYGSGTYYNIDYGGLENEDVYMSGKYMLENYDFLDKDRVGIMGWSHGGMITLMNLMQHPGEYKCGFAGVPVSDVIMRMGFSTDSYRKIFSAPGHIGKTPRENIEEYKRRSPVWNVKTLKEPVLIHTNTTDDDVFFIEVEHLIQALKAEGKQFDYKIFDNAPGGHSFDRMDTKGAGEIRLDIYKYLAKYLKPPKPFKSVKELRQAAYKY